MKQTLIAHVQDHPGVLARVASLFRCRNFNIESLTVGHSELPGISRMTLVWTQLPSRRRLMSSSSRSPRMISNTK